MPRFFSFLRPFTSTKLPDHINVLRLAPGRRTQTLVEEEREAYAGGDGPGHRAQACFRDAAGNTVGPIESNTLELDTTAPPAVQLALHDGSGWWNATDHAELGFAVPVSVRSGEAGHGRCPASPVVIATGFVPVPSGRR